MVKLRPILFLACPVALGTVLAMAQDTLPDSALQIDSLISLGQSYEVDGELALALQTYENAGEISRREFGLFNENLIEILYLMHRTARTGGDYIGASEFRREAERITRRFLQEQVRLTGEIYGVESREYLDAKLALADWLANQQSLDRDAREVYVEALRLVEDHFDDTPELKVNLLRAMAEGVGQPLVTYVEFGGTGSWRILSEPSELVRARRLAKRFSSDDPGLHAAVLRDIGDWRMAHGRPDSAIKSYRQAWKLLEESEDGDALQRELFFEPQIIRDGMVRSSIAATFSNVPDAPEAQVELDFVVDESGQAHRVRVVSAEPPWAADAAVNLVASSSFRPRFADDSFIAAPGRYTWTFHYDPIVAAGRGLISGTSD
jgi:tetratricopeptide (TPR) repeat protein